MQKISPSIYLETKYRGGNTGFVVTKEGLVLIDTPMDPVAAVKWHEEIDRKGKLLYLINTECHIDHILTTYEFPGIYVSHEGIRRALLVQSADAIIKECEEFGLPIKSDYQVRIPTITFSDRLTLNLGGQTIELINFPGHTSSQTGVYIPEEKVLFVGDNITHKEQIFLQDKSCNPFQWLRTLAIIELMDVDVIVPGHGDVCDRSYIPEVSSFIRDYVDAVRKAISQGLSKEEAMDKISFLDRYPMPIGIEDKGPFFQRLMVSHVYEVLTTQKP